MQGRHSEVAAARFNQGRAGGEGKDGRMPGCQDARRTAGGAREVCVCVWEGGRGVGRGRRAGGGEATHQEEQQDQADHLDGFPPPWRHLRFCAVTRGGLCEAAPRSTAVHATSIHAHGYGRSISRHRGTLSRQLALATAAAEERALCLLLPSRQCTGKAQVPIIWRPGFPMFKIKGLPGEKRKHDVSQNHIFWMLSKFKIFTLT